MSNGGHIIRNKSVAQSGVDLDDEIVPGVSVYSAPTNGPGASDYLVEVYVARVGADRLVAQRALDLATGTANIRLYDGTIWGSWAAFGGEGGGGGSGNAAVRAATTANITISTALNNGDSIDGVTLATDDLVLVKNQSSPAENGIYKVGVSPARQTGYTTYAAFPGLIVTVAEGTVNADTTWICTSNAGGTIDVTALAFADQVLSRAVSRVDAAILHATRPASGSVFTRARSATNRDVYTNAANPENTWEMVEVHFNGASSNAWHNGLQTLTNVDFGAGGGLTGFRVGVNAGGTAGQSWIGYIAEVMIWSRALTSEERNKYVAYVVHRYNPDLYDPPTSPGGGAPAECGPGNMLVRDKVYGAYCWSGFGGV